MDTLCHRCNESDHCREPFPQDECDNFHEKITNEYIIRLFYGMSKTMQHSIIEIMKATQQKGEKDVRKT